MESPEPIIADKFRILLQYLCAMSRYPGEMIEFDVSCDYSVICAKNHQEAIFYLESLAEQRFCVREKPFTGSSLPRYTVSAEGWRELDRLENAGETSSDAFTAMWFDVSRAPVEAAIGRAVHTAGYKPIRIDRVEHVNRIDDEMIARIRRSNFLIADFTG
jgi:hypothetical protein